MKNDDEYKMILKKMVEHTTRACEQLKIPYYFAEGSCLGAVRHNGFIPWDDDIDIAIPSSYVDMFIEKVPILLGERYSIKPQFKEDDSFQIIDKEISIFSGVANRKHPWIDILVIYGMPKNAILREIHYLNFFIHQKFYKLSDPDNIQHRDRGFIENTIIKIANKLKLNKLFDKRTCLKKVEMVLKRFPYDKCSYVMAYGSWYFKKEIMPKYIYGNGKSADFEGLRIRVPSHFDTYLSHLYGDYMEIPPKKQRIGKHKITVIKDYK